MSEPRDSSTTTAQPPDPADDHWWTHVTTTDAINTPIRELITGLDEIATLPIPYTHLPPRVRNAYSPGFTRWSDLATQTVQSLLSRPKVGDAGVRALLTAAQDTITANRTAAASPHNEPAIAVRQLIDRLEPRDRAILSARLWPPLPEYRRESQRALAERLGINPISIQRNQPRAEARFAELLADPAHREVTHYAHQLRRRLGPYAPAATVTAELRRLDVDPTTETAHLLLHLAGPYICQDEWFDNTTTTGRQQAAAAVNTALAANPAPTTQTLTNTLTAIGMPRDIVTTYLHSHNDLKRFNDVWVRWGDTTADKAEAALHAHGTPIPAEDIHTAIGPDTITLRPLRDTLFSDPRFVRATRQTWGLHHWGITDYGGIFDEITTRIAAAGGQANVDQLTTDLLATYPDIAESSVRTYLSTPAFIIEAGTVRKRTDTDPLPPVPPLHTARGAFRLGANEIRQTITVTFDVLRGSGITIRPTVATALGVNPGQRRAFTSPYGEIPVAWGLSSPNGPRLGSLRAPATATGATLNDTLVLIFRFRSDCASLEFVRIPAEVTGIHRLRQILGRPVRTPSAALAAALKCKRADVATLLRSRGDTDLADLAENEPHTTLETES